MPIKIERTTNPETGKPVLKIEIDNGDLGGFDNALKKWTFVDEESMLRFTIAVLLSSPNRRLYVDDNGKKSVLEPTEKLLSGKAAEAETNDTETTAK